MVFGDRSIDDRIQVAGEIIQNLKKFEYLGSLLTWDHNCAEDQKASRKCDRRTGFRETHMKQQETEHR